MRTLMIAAAVLLIGALNADAQTKATRTNPNVYRPNLAKPVRQPMPLMQSGNFNTFPNNFNSGLNPYVNPGLSSPGIYSGGYPSYNQFGYPGVYPSYYQGGYPGMAYPGFNYPGMYPFGGYYGY